MENTLIKIEDRGDGMIVVTLNGDTNMLSGMLASAIKNEEMFGDIFENAMVILLAYEASKNDEAIKKARLN
jgi:hypothetical protein